jgi:regulator of sigma E protease
MTTALAIALAIVGLMTLVVLHELGHFFAAKACGMRVEKLYLFFGKPIWKTQRGETEYGIGSIPLGGYAKISGMTPEEDLDPEVVPRAYYNQSAWKRIVVILAGPAVNLAVAFLILFGIAFTAEEPTALAVGPIVADTPADGKLQEGDRILSIDGHPPSDRDAGEQATRFAGLVADHECKGDPTEGCRAQTPVRIVVERNGERVPLEIRPYYDDKVDRTRLGFAFSGADYESLNPSVPEAAQDSLDDMWFVTSETATTLAQLFKPEEREKLSGVVGIVDATRSAIQFDAELALQVLGLVSLSLALFNLLPFLPLDGGHVFWTIVEKVRGRRVSLRTMEQASMVGLMLFAVIFVIGFTNDIDRISNGGFDFR